MVCERYEQTDRPTDRHTCTHNDHNTLHLSNNVFITFQQSNDVRQCHSIINVLTSYEHIQTCIKTCSVTHFENPVHDCIYLGTQTRFQIAKVKCALDYCLTLTNRCRYRSKNIYDDSRKLELVIRVMNQQQITNKNVYVGCQETDNK